jgi:hypothetical protein
VAQPERWQGYAGIFGYLPVMRMPMPLAREHHEELTHS